MIQAVNINFGGESYSVFLEDSDSGYNALDVLNIPGVYTDITDAIGPMFLADMDGSNIGGAVLTTMLGLIIQPGFKAEMVNFWDGKLGSLLRLPKTARQSVMASYETTERDMVQRLLNVIEGLQVYPRDKSVSIPESAFQFMDEELKKKMFSNRKTYALRSVDNQEIFQKSDTEEFGISLPTLDEIHSEGFENEGTLDILRVIAPYRKQNLANPKATTYSSIYHTPFYKIDPRLRGIVPAHLSWISGNYTNDTLAIQPNERHMYNNFVTLICSDSSRNAASMATAIFLHTKFGTTLRAIATCQDKELLPSLIAAAQNEVPDGCKCDFSNADMDKLSATTTRQSDIPKYITVPFNIVQEAIEQAYANKRFIVDISGIPFKLTFSDDEKYQLAERFRDSFLTRAMHEFLLQFCCDAYTVNWGHTGVTRAISRLTAMQGIATIDAAMAQYLPKRLTDGSVSGAMQITPEIAPLYSLDDYQDTDVDGDFGDEASSPFTYYVAPETANRIATGSLSGDYFASKATGAESAATRAVERWHQVNGDNNLRYFLNSAYLATGDYTVLVSSALRLLRWGSRKPRSLVIAEHPEIRTVFDLNAGEEATNTAILDDSQVVKVNGCSYTFAGYLESKEIGCLIGCVLVKDYTVVKKQFLASLADIAELADAKDVVEFCSVMDIPHDAEHTFYIEDMYDQDFDLVVTESKIEEGLKIGVVPKDLSELALLSVKGMYGSKQYLRSLKNEVIVTTKDRQFDILRRYVDDVVTFCSKKKSEIQNLSMSSQLVQLAKEFVSMKNTEQKQDANTAYAAGVLSTMNFDNAPGINFSSLPLRAPYSLVWDKENTSGMEPLVFSDGRMARLSSQLGDRIVLLMTEFENKLILCRKDIVASELKVTPEKRVSTMGYAAVRRIVDKLKSGETAFVNMGGNRLECVLHESLKDVL